MNRSIKLYNILLDKNFTKEEAEAMISEIEATVDRKYEDVKNVLSTRNDLNNVEKSLREGLNNVEKSLREEFRKSTLSIKDDITKLILWMVGLIGLKSLFNII